MNIPVEKPTTIPDGVHQGKIIAVNYRTNPYKYTDYVIEFGGEDNYQLKCGFPTKLYVNSKHGTMLKSFGLVVQEGLQVDPDVMIGKHCTFQTITKGKFAEIIQESLKPIQPVDITSHMNPTEQAEHKENVEQLQQEQQQQ